MEKCDKDLKIKEQMTKNQRKCTKEKYSHETWWKENLHAHNLTEKKPQHVDIHSSTFFWLVSVI